MSRYVAQRYLLLTYVSTVRAPAAITVQPMARPSNPSVRFTAFDEPTITKPTKTRKGINAKGQKCFEFINEWITRSGRTRFRNGIINWVEYALWVVRTRSAAPTTRLMNT